MFSSWRLTVSLCWFVLPNMVWHIDGSADFLIGNSCLLWLETRLIRAMIINQSGKVPSHETKSWQMLKCKVELMGTTESSDDFLYFQITHCHVYFSLGALNLSLCKLKSWFIVNKQIQYSTTVKADLGTSGWSGILGVKRSALVLQLSLR